MAIPHKIGKVNGYVYTEYIGVLPYETKKDQQQLIALMQIYCQGAKRGAFPQDIGQKSFSLAKATRGEKLARNTLFMHAALNHRLYSPEGEALLKRLARKEKKEVIALTMKELKKLLGDGVFAGELIKR